MTKKFSLLEVENKRLTNLITEIDGEKTTFLIELE